MHLYWIDIGQLSVLSIRFESLEFMLCVDMFVRVWNFKWEPFSTISFCVVCVIRFFFELNPINKYSFINKIDLKSNGGSMKMIYLNAYTYDETLVRPKLKAKVCVWNPCELNEFLLEIIAVLFACWSLIETTKSLEHVIHIIEWPKSTPNGFFCRHIVSC